MGVQKGCRGLHSCDGRKALVHLGCQQGAGMAWNGVAWRGVAWRGVAWRGVAWRGVAWERCRKRLGLAGAPVCIRWWVRCEAAARGAQRGACSASAVLPLRRHHGDLVGGHAVHAARGVDLDVRGAVAADDLRAGGFRAREAGRPGSGIPAPHAQPAALQVSARAATQTRNRPACCPRAPRSPHLLAHVIARAPRRQHVALVLPGLGGGMDGGRWMREWADR
jgi:hypothetical protein